MRPKREETDLGMNSDQEEQGRDRHQRPRPPRMHDEGVHLVRVEVVREPQERPNCGSGRDVNDRVLSVMTKSVVVLLRRGNVWAAQRQRMAHHAGVQSTKGDTPRKEGGESDRGGHDAPMPGPVLHDERTKEEGHRAGVGRVGRREPVFEVVSPHGEAFDGRRVGARDREGIFQDRGDVCACFIS